ncbi:MAG: ATP-grasp fold amidoligase family protein [Hyphomicrobiales bacterium]
MNIKKTFRHASRIALGERLYEKIQFRRHTGYALDLTNPRTWNEKLTARKLDRGFRDALILQDKYASRALVEARVGTKYLTEVYDITDDPVAIDPLKYPNRFVLKATNSCGPKSLFIHDKETRCEPELARQKAWSIFQMHDRIFDKFYYYSNEWWYGEIPKRLMVEAFLTDGHGKVPLDYKFFVFHGRVYCIQVDFGRFVDHTRAIYDRDWKRMDVRIGYPNGPEKARPANLDEMIDVAETIAADYGFLRVDLYNIDDETIRFGETTIAPSLGHARIDPVSFDKELGALWNLAEERPSYAK